MFGDKTRRISYLVKRLIRRRRVWRAGNGEELCERVSLLEVEADADEASIAEAPGEEVLEGGLRAPSLGALLKEQRRKVVTISLKK